MREEGRWREREREREERVLCNELMMTLIYLTFTSIIQYRVGYAGKEL